MYIFLTDKKNKPQELVSKLDAKKLVNYIESVKPVEMDYITIPKFKIKQEYELDNIFPKMGIRAAFSENADFSGISDGKFYLSKSIHKAVVEIDEKGTVASAGTSGQINTRQVPIIFNVENPFMFLTRVNNVVRWYHQQHF
ncbi:serpin B10-like [Brevipalpus obovatus]|uniref:serpin B10-like n=1 Tax=Brevipalpus obovatus TaxID=246614 RepID=UPI003D9EC67B